MSEVPGHGRHAMAPVRWVGLAAPELNDRIHSMYSTMYRRRDRQRSRLRVPATAEKRHAGRQKDATNN